VPFLRQGAQVGSRRRQILLAAALAAFTASACVGPSDPPDNSAPSDRSRTATPQVTTTTRPPPEPTSPPSPITAAASDVPPIDEDAPEPVHIEIADIGVSAAVIPLGIDTTGALEVPSDFSQTGWWTRGPEPGEQGPAVIVGHVDSRRGPAVFFRLRELHLGALVAVHRADSSTVQFVVDRIEQHPKSRFPTRAVYDPTPGAELRLVTCGGSFDRGSGHYLDNVIVFAHRS
jgi:sortase (surface protein transpeptidase)